MRFVETVSADDTGTGFYTTLASEAELLQRTADFYRKARVRSGVDIPALNHLLALPGYDPQPAQGLLDRHKGLDYPYICQFGNVKLEIDEGVFCPDLTNVSPFLREQIDVGGGERVLDAFAGSGAFGIYAALRGNQVVAFDDSSKAVACARKNATNNGVVGNVDVRHGTLEETINPDERFDLIIANPPLIPGDPNGLIEAAIFDPDLSATKAFVAALPRLLAPKGRCYLLTSDVIDRVGYEFGIAARCKELGLREKVVAQHHTSYESYRVHKIEWPAVRRLLSLLGMPKAS